MFLSFWVWRGIWVWLRPPKSFGPLAWESATVRPQAEIQPQNHRGPIEGAGKGSSTLRPIWSLNPGVGGGRMEDYGRVARAGRGVRIGVS